MSLLAEVIVIMIAAMMPIMLTAVFVFYPRDERQSFAFLEETRIIDDTVPVLNATWQPRPVWYLELTNANSGVRIGKRFQEELILGRFVGTGEQRNMLYLDRSNTISRRHVRAAVTDGGVTIENLSQVNMARLNGKVLQYPDWLHLRDQLQVGDETYIVTAVSRVA